MKGKCWKCNLFVADGLKNTMNGLPYYSDGLPNLASTYSGFSKNRANIPNYKRVWRGSKNGRLPNNFINSGFIKRGDVLAYSWADGSSHMGISVSINGVIQIIGAGKFEVGIHTSTFKTGFQTAVEFSVWRKN